MCHSDVLPLLPENLGDDADAGFRMISQNVRGRGAAGSVQLRWASAMGAVIVVRLGLAGSVLLKTGPVKKLLHEHEGERWVKVVLATGRDTFISQAHKAHAGRRESSLLDPSEAIHHDGVATLGFEDSLAGEIGSGGIEDFGFGWLDDSRGVLEICLSEGSDGVRDLHASELLGEFPTGKDPDLRSEVGECHCRLLRPGDADKTGFSHAVSGPNHSHSGFDGIKVVEGGDDVHAGLATQLVNMRVEQNTECGHSDGGDGGLFDNANDGSPVGLLERDEKQPVGLSFVDLVDESGDAVGVSDRLLLHSDAHRQLLGNLLDFLHVHFLMPLSIEAVTGPAIVSLLPERFRGGVEEGGMDYCNRFLPGAVCCWRLFGEQVSGSECHPGGARTEHAKEVTPRHSKEFV